jgi:Domain of unknown function (DUF4365)
MTSNRVKERIGINAVSRVVEIDWESGWQEYAAQNDDAIDGAILLRRGSKQPVDTGGIVFVQVKCGGNGYRRDQKQYPDHIGVALGKTYVQAHQPRWRKVPGPAVLIFVDDTLNKANPPAWWADLKLEESYSPTNGGLLLIPKTQRFGHHSKGAFHRLCRSGPSDRQLEEIKMLRNEILIPRLGKGESLRDDAWSFYKGWRDDAPSCVNPVLGRLLVNRVGWKHMTRRDRLPERIVQSWQLLGAAKAMVKSCRNVSNLGHATTHRYEDGNTQVIDYLGLRANVVFPHRHQSIVQVVLRRSRLVAPSHHQLEREKIWFYSVYELRRGVGQV